MTVVWLVLRDQDQVRLERELFQVGNAWLVLLLGNGEERVEDDGGADKPGVEEDGEGAWELSRRGKWSQWGTEDQQEGAITVERLDRQGHGRGYAERIAPLHGSKT